MLNEITNAEFLRTDHGYFNRPIDHQSTTNDRLKPVLTTGLVKLILTGQLPTLIQVSVSLNLRLYFGAEMATFCIKHVENIKIFF